MLGHLHLRFVGRYHDPIIIISTVLHVSRVTGVFLTSPTSRQIPQVAPHVWKVLLSLLLGSLDLYLDFTDPSNPIFTGTTEISVSCGSTFNNTSSLLPSVTAFSQHLEDCPLYSRKIFCFSIFFVYPLHTEVSDLPMSLHRSFSTPD